MQQITLFFKNYELGPELPVNKGRNILLNPLASVQCLTAEAAHAFAQPYLMIQGSETFLTCFGTSPKSHTCSILPVHSNPHLVLCP